MLKKIMRSIFNFFSFEGKRFNEFNWYKKIFVILFQVLILVFTRHFLPFDNNYDLFFAFFIFLIYAFDVYSLSISVLIFGFLDFSFSDSLVMPLLNIPFYLFLLYMLRAYIYDRYKGRKGDLFDLNIYSGYMYFLTLFFYVGFMMIGYMVKFGVGPYFEVYSQELSNLLFGMVANILFVFFFSKGFIYSFNEFRKKIVYFREKSIK